MACVPTPTQLDDAPELAVLDALDTARVKGSVRNLHDRRPELYRVEWTGGE